MAAGERGKAIEEAVEGFRRGQEELRLGAGTARGILGEQRGQIRTDIGAQRELTEAGFDPFIQAGTGALQDVQRGATIGGLDERIAQIFGTGAFQDLQQGARVGGFAPFIEAGTGALRDVQRAGTVGGLDERIAEILGSGAFQTLREERFGDVNRQLASAGLSRSGEALRQISDISPDLAFQLEQQQFGRQQQLANLGLQIEGRQFGRQQQLANRAFQLEQQQFGRTRDIAGLGFQGVGQRGQLGAQLTLGQAGFETGLGSLEAQIANQLGVRLSGAEVGIGQAQSEGRLAALQAKEAKSSQLLELAGGLAGAVVGGPIGGALAKKFISSGAANL